MKHRKPAPQSDIGPTRGDTRIPMRPDVEVIDRPDIAAPLRTVRGAQRVPGYHRLWREGSITDQQRDAADRYNVLAARASGAVWRPDGPAVRQPGQNYGPTEMQIDATTRLRLARAVLGRHGTRIADLVAIDGASTEAVASALGTSRHVARGSIVAVLERLAEHWRLDA